jgi:hypothetical protein
LVSLVLLVPPDARRQISKRASIREEWKERIVGKKEERRRKSEVK